MNKPNIEIVDQVPIEWEYRPSIPLGKVPSAEPQADSFVLVENNGDTFLRLDIYFSRPFFNFSTKAISWNEWVVVGCCNEVFFVSLADGKTVSISTTDDGTDGFSEYFMDFWIGEDFLLVVTGAGLIKVGTDCNILWRSDPLAVDGVVLHSVSSETIVGDGEWDPPGGWKPFKIKTSTGKKCLS